MPGGGGVNHVRYPANADADGMVIMPSNAVPNVALS